MGGRSHEGDYQSAADGFTAILGFDDAQIRLTDTISMCQQAAMDKLASGDTVSALTLLSSILKYDKCEDEFAAVYEVIATDAKNSADQGDFKTALAAIKKLPAGTLLDETSQYINNRGAEKIRLLISQNNYQAARTLIDILSTNGATGMNDLLKLSYKNEFIYLYAKGDYDGATASLDAAQNDGIYFTDDEKIDMYSPLVEDCEDLGQYGSAFSLLTNELSGTTYSKQKLNSSEYILTQHSWSYMKKSYYSVSCYNLKFGVTMQENSYFGSIFSAVYAMEDLVGYDGTGVSSNGVIGIQYNYLIIDNEIYYYFGTNIADKTYWGKIVSLKNNGSEYELTIEEADGTRIIYENL